MSTHSVVYFQAEEVSETRHKNNGKMKVTKSILESSVEFKNYQHAVTVYMVT